MRAVAGALPRAADDAEGLRAGLDGGHGLQDRRPGARASDESAPFG